MLFVGVSLVNLVAAAKMDIHAKYAVTASCGFHSDCEPHYTLAHINASAARWGVCDAQSRRMAKNLNALHAQAVANCSGNADFQKTGSYCLATKSHTITKGDPRRRRVHLPHGQSYTLPFDPTCVTSARQAPHRLAHDTCTHSPFRMPSGSGSHMTQRTHSPNRIISDALE